MALFEDDEDDFDRTISVRRPTISAEVPAAVTDKRAQERRQSNVRVFFITLVVIAVLYLAKPVVVPVALAVLFAVYAYGRRREVSELKVLLHDLQDRVGVVPSEEQLDQLTQVIKSVVTKPMAFK